MLHHKIVSVKALPDLMLYVGFEDGTYKRYDAFPLTQKWEPFQAFLITPRLFEQVRVDAGGFGVSWNDDIDLSSEELWDNGQQVPAPPKSAYAAQIKHNRKKYVRFPLDLPPDTLSAFRDACKVAGTTPTAEIKRFIAEYTVHNAQK